MRCSACVTWRISIIHVAQEIEMVRPMPLESCNEQRRDGGAEQRDEAGAEVIVNIKFYHHISDGLNGWSVCTPAYDILLCNFSLYSFSSLIWECMCVKNQFRSGGSGFWEPEVRTSATQSSSTKRRTAAQMRVETSVTPPTTSMRPPIYINHSDKVGISTQKPIPLQLFTTLNTVQFVVLWGFEWILMRGRTFSWLCALVAI